MNFRMIGLILSVLITMTLLSGCTDTITDTATEKKIKVIQNPDSSLTKVKVQTDGMLGDFGYGHSHPFGIDNEVMVDMNYYEKHTISRGDIVVFKTKKNKDRNTDIARIVGLPGETIQIKKGQVYIDGDKLVAFYGNDSTFNNNDSWNAVELKQNEYYILADVRWRGLNDSQTNGSFIKQDILGKVIGYVKK